jgi:7-cyano-7-deazaguanine synthase in queuosine biosynthesis
MKRLLLLNGGGMDSLAVAKIARRDHPATFIKSLTIGLGLPNQSRVVVAANLIANTYCDSHETVFLTKDTGVQVQMGMPLVGNLFGVPFYALQLLTLGMSYGMLHGCGAVLSGLKPDAIDEQYLPAFRQVLASSRPTMKAITSKPELWTPIFEMPNDDIFKEIKDDPLLSQTVSCNQAEPCGRCGKCKLRIQLGVPLS